MFLLWTFLGAIIANLIYAYVSFNEHVRTDAWKAYPLGIFASAIGAISWMYMIRHLRHEHIFLANLSWDVLVALLIVILPIFIYGIKLDLKAILGCILAISGIILVHFGEAK
jgi:hypothetical protein